MLPLSDQGDGSADRLEIRWLSAERKAMLVTDRPSLTNACVAGLRQMDFASSPLIANHKLAFFADVFG